MKYLIPINVLLLFAFSGQTQNVDTSILKVPSLLKLVESDNRIWTKEEILTLLNVENISLHFIKSKGFKDILFFTLQYPENGIPVKKINDTHTLLFDPELTQGKITFAYDIPTNSLFALDIGNFKDLLRFYYLVQHRTTSSYKKIYKKKIWKKDLKIKGLSMINIFNVCQSLKKISN